MNSQLSRRTTLAKLAGLAATAGITSSFSARAGAIQEDESLITFEMNDLIDERAASGRPYLPFLERSTLRCGLYVLAPGAEDRQRPHETDEVYYVVAGTANIRVEDEVRAVSPGSVIYVRAGADHRFIDIEQELRLLVFFD